MVILATLSDDDEDYVNKVVRDVQVCPRNCPRNCPKFVHETVPKIVTNEIDHELFSLMMMIRTE